MNARSLALLIEQEHNEVDCCDLHSAIFTEALAVIAPSVMVTTFVPAFGIN